MQQLRHPSLVGVVTFYSAVLEGQAVVTEAE